MDDFDANVFDLTFDLAKGYEGEVEFYVRKNALRVARDWHMLPEYRRTRREIRRKERERRAKLKAGNR